MRRYVELVTSSPIGIADCANCGDKWGSHLGIKCPRGGLTFEPVGYTLEEKCRACGHPLRDHNKHAICPDDLGIFEKIIDMFNDKDFLL